MQISDSRGYVPWQCVYLGRAEKAPVIDVEEVTIPFYTDVSGPSIPFDRLHQGQVGVIEAMLTQWNEPVRQFLANMPSRNDFSANRNGSTDLVDIGSGMALNRFSFPVWVLFPNAANPGYGGMPGGYRFWSCTRRSVQTLPGSTAERVHLVLDANRALGVNGFNPLNVASVHSNISKSTVLRPGMSATLYDYDVSDAAPIVN